MKGFSMRNVIDLYAGAGGLSLGAARSGFRVAAAVENDLDALETHQKNFPTCKHSDADVASLSGADLFRLANLKKGTLEGLLGSAPCQGFSVIGQRQAKDKRNELFVHFFRLVAEMQPKFFLTENVPHILSDRYNSLRQRALKKVPRHYVLLDSFLVRASDYGAPTTRTRVFFFGYDPKQFHCELTPESFLPSKRFQVPYVRKALEGLPRKISPDWLSEEAGWRPSTKIRNSYFFKRTSGCIPEGVGDKIALDRYLNKGEVSGCMGTRHRSDVEERYRHLEYGQRDPVSKSTKLDPDGFCLTLRAGTGKDKGRFQAVRPIHYQWPRVITPREAARLQGFPDWFVFHRTKWHSFRQIGNSVSPIVAEQLLTTIIRHL
jgi:DNA (cytosine-5)-methyltransferase 1